MLGRQCVRTDKNRLDGVLHLSHMRPTTQHLTEPESIVCIYNHLSAHFIIQFPCCLCGNGKCTESSEMDQTAQCMHCALYVVCHTVSLCCAMYCRGVQKAASRKRPTRTKKVFPDVITQCSVMQRTQCYKP